MDTEEGYDFVDILDSKGAVKSHVSGTTKPDAISDTKIYVKFAADSSVDKTGFKATWKPAN